MAVQRIMGRNLIVQDDGDSILREGTVPVYADATAVKAIPAADRFDGMIVQQADTGDIFVFDKEATAANLSEAQEPMKLIPTAGTGKWFRLGQNSHVLMGTSQRVLNDSGVAISQYDEVYLKDYDPTTGLLTIAKARANALGTAAAVRTALNAIGDGKIGYVAKDLALINQDTSTATAQGSPVFLSDAVAGARVFDGSAPTGANSRHVAGRVVKKHATSGVIYINHENRAEEHNHADAARGQQITATGIAANGITADATGRAIFQAGLFDNATVESVFAANALGATATSRALFANNFWDNATVEAKFAANAFGATATSRALFANNFWDNATVEAKFAANAFGATATSRALFAANFWDSATVDTKFAAGAFGATAAARALFVANFIDAATWLDKVAVDAIVSTSFSGAAKKFGAGALDTAGITSLIAASGFTAAHFSGASIKFAAGALDAAGLASFIGVDAFTTASMSGAAKKFAAGALDVAGTLSIFAANAFSEANVDAIFAAGGVNGSKLKATTVNGSKLTNDARLRFIAVSVPGALFGTAGSIRYNVLPGIAGTVQAMQVAYEVGPNGGGNVIVDMNKNGTNSMFSVAPDFSLNLNPLYVGFTTDVGATYTDATAATTDSNAATQMTVGALDTAANGDWILIGHASLKFGRIYVDMDAINVNAVVSTVAVDYWDGAAWQAATLISNTTTAGGATFAQDGIIEFSVSGLWAQSAVGAHFAGSAAGYYVRLKVSAAQTAGTAMDEIRVGHAERRFHRFACDQNNTLTATDSVDLVIDDTDATAQDLSVIIEILPS